MAESRKRAVIETATLNFDSIAAGATEELTVESADAKPGGIVALGQPPSFPAGLIATGYINGDGEVVVRVLNTTEGAIDPGGAEAVAATVTLTMDTQPANGDTLTVGGKAYTFQTSLTDVDGNIARGADLAAAKVNLVAAINLAGGGGTLYADAMTANANVSIAAFGEDVAVLTAKVPGRAGNALTTAETFTAETNIFSASTFSGGEDAGEGTWKIGLIV